jgi:hypothetical protein
VRLTLDVHHHFPADLSASLCRIEAVFLSVRNTQEIVMARMVEVLAAVARIEGNTANVERALGTVNTELAAARQQITDLQEQIANGTAATEEQLQEALDRLDAADRAMDAIAPEAPVEPPVEPPTDTDPVVPPVEDPAVVTDQDVVVDEE